MLLLGWERMGGRRHEKSADKDVEKEHLCTLGGVVNQHSHFGKVWRMLKKLKIKLPYDSAVPILGIYPM